MLTKLGKYGMFKYRTTSYKNKHKKAYRQGILIAKMKYNKTKIINSISGIFVFGIGVVLHKMILLMTYFIDIFYFSISVVENTHCF